MEFKEFLNRYGLNHKTTMSYKKQLEKLEDYFEKKISVHRVTQKKHEESTKQMDTPFEIAQR